MWNLKAAGTGKYAFEMISRDLQVAHHQKKKKKNLAQPYFANWRFDLKVWLIKKNEK